MVFIPRGSMRATLLLAFGAISIASPALAAPPVKLASAMFVERVDRDHTRTLQPAQSFSRGDRVVYVLNWSRVDGEGGFVVTNPLAQRLAYQGSADDSAEVSVDGGRTWGKLGELRIGTRLASSDEVTHVRWHVVGEVASRGSGQIAYSAIVR